MLDSILHGNPSPDEHWQPVWRTCPVCHLNFSVYARVEHMEEDAELFKQLAGISDKGGDKVEESNNTPKLEIRLGVEKQR